MHQTPTQHSVCRLFGFPPTPIKKTHPSSSAHTPPHKKPSLFIPPPLNPTPLPQKKNSLTFLHHASSSFPFPLLLFRASPFHPPVCRNPSPPPSPPTPHPTNTHSASYPPSIIYASFLSRVPSQGPQEPLWQPLQSFLFDDDVICQSPSLNGVDDSSINAPGRAACAFVLDAQRRGGCRSMWCAR